MVALDKAMTETEFNAQVDQILLGIERSIEAANADVDFELNGGVLEITFANDTKIIVNRQTPNREIWVAARSGGFHFAFRDGAWRDTRSGDELFASLARVIASQAGVEA